NAEVQQRMQGTVWTSGCSSWYLDARGRNTTLWPGFTWDYRRKMRRFDAANYYLTSQRVPSPVQIG
ncbi:MAG TPA: 4-hydroxyacetophenone monooxygenase, partial [Ktedonobacterales bacterium]